MAAKKKTEDKKTYKGKSTKPGGGGKFAKVKDALEKKGKSEDSAKAIAASAGRKKFGKEKMEDFAKKGKKKASAKKGKK